MDHALAVLREKRDVLERSARRLLEKETLDEKDLIELIGPPAGPPLRVAAG
jgi:cell division protease FtsH